MKHIKMKSKEIHKTIANDLLVRLHKFAPQLEDQLLISKMVSLMNKLYVVIFFSSVENSVCIRVFRRYLVAKTFVRSRHLKNYKFYKADQKSLECKLFFDMLV